MKFLIPIVLLLIANPDKSLYPVLTGTIPHDGLVERYGYALEPLRDQISEVASMWDPSSSQVISTKVSFSTSKDFGGILNARIIKSSGDVQLDAECLQAVCTNPPRANLWWRTGDLEERVIDFATIRRREGLENEVTRHIAEHRIDGRIFVYQIPLSVWSHYPQLVSIKELRQVSNLMDLKSEGYEAQIRHQGAVWANFFSTHPTPTRQEINDCALATMEMPSR
jgi:hypothetical protein